MSEQEARRIIQEEKLDRVNWYDDQNLKENQVGIRKTKNGWEVYITDERAAIITGTRFQYSDSDEAYDELVGKARYLKDLFK